MTHVTCRLTAKNRDQLRNPAFGSRVRASFMCNSEHDVHVYSYCSVRATVTSTCQLPMWSFSTAALARRVRRPMTSSWLAAILMTSLTVSGNNLSSHVDGRTERLLGCLDACRTLHCLPLNPTAPIYEHGDAGCGNARARRC